MAGHRRAARTREARRAAARARPPVSGAAVAGRRGGLLQPRLQRHALAALPLLLRPVADHAGGLAALRRGERALRRGDPRPLRARHARLDPRLPPHARARDAPRPRAPAVDRLLPAYAVPVLGGLPAPARSRAAAPRRARRRLRQLPDRRLRAALPLVVLADPGRRLGARLARGRRQARRASASTRSASTSRASARRSPRRRPRAISPISSASTKDGSSSSASSASTTRRGSRTSCRRTSASSNAIPTARARRR